MKKLLTEPVAMTTENEIIALKILKSNITGYRGNIQHNDALKAMEEYALYTKPVSEERMMNEANKFLNSDTPDIKKAVESNYWAVYRMAQFALWMQQRQVNPPNKQQR